MIKNATLQLCMSRSIVVPWLQYAQKQFEGGISPLGTHLDLLLLNRLILQQDFNLLYKAVKEDLSKLVLKLIQTNRLRCPELQNLLPFYSLLFLPKELCLLLFPCYASLHADEL